MFWPNGDIYKGEWAGSKRNGRGEIKLGNGEWMQGLFSNDVLIDANIQKIAEKSKENVENFHNRLREDMILDLDPYYEEEV